MNQFSIILPVRNGGEYIKDCVNSILTQTLQDFNLLVLDNNSTDGTKEWIESLNDIRIKLFPSTKSLSIEENWRRITSIPKNKFITLIGHDDLLDKDYLTTINNLITKYPAASLYQTHFRYINSVGNTIKKCKPMPEVLSAGKYLELLLNDTIDTMGTGFIMRSADYDSIGGIPDYPNLLYADFELWIRLAEKGYMVTAPAECFSFRVHQSTTSISADDKYHAAFERLIQFFKKLKITNEEMSRIIAANGDLFIKSYGKGLTHRLLRTPLAKRNYLRVNTFVAKCSEYAKELNPETKFNPFRMREFVLAKLIDSNRVSRSLFLIFKKVYSKPIYS